MHSASRLAVLFCIPALLLLMFSLTVWLAFSAGQTGFGPMQLRPLPSASTAPGAAALDAPPPTQLERLSPLQAKLRNALLPVSHLPRGTANVYHATGESEARALGCLTEAIYYEAGREPEIGKRAVAQVVVNRASNVPFPSTICGVVEQGAPRPGCQFTFMCDGSLGRRPDPALWADARRIADAVLKGETEPSVGDATHYHADYVFPTWAPTMAKLVQIGTHIFYRWNAASVRLIPPASADAALVATSAQIETATPGVAQPTTLQPEVVATPQTETITSGRGEENSAPLATVAPAATPAGGALPKAPVEPHVQKPPEARSQPRRAIPERSLRSGIP